MNGSGASRSFAFDRSTDAAANPFPASGYRVCFSSPHNEKPYYIQRVVNDWVDGRYWGAHKVDGEFATREEAEARAEELARG